MGVHNGTIHYPYLLLPYALCNFLSLTQPISFCITFFISSVLTRSLSCIVKFKLIGNFFDNFLSWTLRDTVIWTLIQDHQILILILIFFSLNKIAIYKLNNNENENENGIFLASHLPMLPNPNLLPNPNPNLPINANDIKIMKNCTIILL